MALSFFLNIAIRLIKNPAIPKAVMAKVGTGIEYCIFAQIKMMKTMLSPMEHFPVVVFGRIVSPISL